jgi:photosystem II stability/assembly factor-like uncharacterized protein
MKVLRFLKTFIISLLFSFGVSATVHAQWEQLEEPYGGEIFAIVQAGNTIYAGGRHLFISTDNGNSWQVLSSFEKGSVSSLLVFNDYLFAGTSSDLYRSPDAGQTWEKLNIPASLDGNNPLCRMNSTLIINTSHTQVPKIYLSADNGDTWNLAEQQPEQGFINGLVAIRQNLYACGDLGIYRSTDEGHHWEVFTKDLHYTETLVYANNSFIAAEWMACYRSADGITWETIYNDLNIPVFILALDSVSGKAQRLIMGTTTNGPDPGGLFYSDDNGSTWSSIEEVNKGNDKIYSILKSGTFLLAGTGSDAVLRSDSQGFTWSVSNTGIKTRRFQKIASGGNLIVASEINERAIFSSADHGITWQFQGIPSIDYEYVTCLSVKDDVIFVGTIDNLYRKKISDSAWDLIIHKYIKNIVDAGQFIFVASTHYLFRSENDGKAWTTFNFGDEIIWDVIADDSIVCVITYQNIYNSTDAGEHFSSTTNTYFHSDYHASGNDDDTFYIVVGGNNLGVYRSDDGGRNWEQVCDTNIWRPTAVTANAGSVCISTESSGVIRSTDDGHTWNSYNDGMPGLSAMDLILMGDTLFTVGYERMNISTLGAGYGVMKRSAFPTGISRIDLQPGFRVSPNPAKEFITLQFQLKFPSTVQYSIYTITGTFLKSGYSKTDQYINVSDLPSGLYVITISGQELKKSAPFIIR